MHLRVRHNDAWQEATTFLAAGTAVTATKSQVIRPDTELVGDWQDGREPVAAIPDQL